jgi:hypothetical protein
MTNGSAVKDYSDLREESEEVVARMLVKVVGHQSRVKRFLDR